VSAWDNDGDGVSGRLLLAMALVAALALVVGLAAGTFIGRSSQPSLATLADQSRTLALALTARLEPAGALYAEGVVDGAVVDPAPYAEAQARIGDAARGLAQDRSALEPLDPAAYGRAQALLAELATAAAEPITAEAFADLLTAALSALAALAGSEPPAP
jgi:hypothetical protein